ncbi:MAG: hypothetical protein J6I86_03675, partial [Bacteroidaceae bacterium]|nr:hypothetical protein [Bacteroidaceae bacterium]
KRHIRHLTNRAFSTKGGLLFKNRIRNACLSALRTIICAHWTFSGQQYLHINDASVEVPAEYTRWEPERAYTFIFKIYHKIDGRTGDQSFADVFPIALDAVIVENINSNVTR